MRSSNVRRKSWSPATRLLALGVALLPALAHADATLKTMSPTGEVALVRQVRATFSESMVKFGDPRLPAPLDVACTPGGTQAGTARWVDDKTWVFDFAKDLPPGTRSPTPENSQYAKRWMLSAVAGPLSSSAKTCSSSIFCHSPGDG